MWCECKTAQDVVWTAIGTILPLHNALTLSHFDVDCESLNKSAFETFKAFKAFNLKHQNMCNDWNITV